MPPTWSAPPRPTSWPAAEAVDLEPPSTASSQRSAARHAGLVVGVRDVGLWSRGDLPDGPRSLFEIGSISKTFTATLLAGMVRDGLVALDDPVAKHLPVAPPVKGREITLEDLATHHSGLPGVPAGMLLPALTIAAPRSLRVLRRDDPP